MNKINLILFFCFLAVTSLAQTQEWSLTDENTKSIPQEELMVRKQMPSKYQIYNLKENSFKNKLKTISTGKKQLIELPTSKGLKTFYIEESSNFSSELALKYPNIKAFTGSQVDDRSVKLLLSKGLDGYHFSVYELGKPTFYVESYTKNNRKFIAYSKYDLQKNTSNFSCEVLDLGAKKDDFNFENKVTNDGLLRTYRLAIVTTGEYSQFQLDRLGISSSATTTVKKEAILSAINTTITRVGGVFQNDLAVKFQLVGDNDGIIFLDPATDNLSNDNPNNLINESQSTLDTGIGNANYDIGHTFSTGAGGLAGLGVICVTGQKGSGVTGIGAPFGDEFDIDFVAHEFGHQFGANHTFNGTTSSCSGANRNDATAVEPGSGTTIMGYAGICAPQNVENDSHDNFHSISITEMTNVILSSGSCAATSSTGNTAPIANAGLDYSIPKSTPFVLKGAASDVNAADVLSYNWEQIDNEVGFTIPPSATNTGGAMFRALPASTSQNRFMPQYSTVLAGNTESTWEVIPSVARELNFSLTVRDNNSNGGSTSIDNVKIAVTNADAFNVTSQNTATTWNAGSSQTITWSKGATDLEPINCQNVTIKLSEDGGLTFPILLIENTPNDGTETIIVPNNVTSQARIMVEAADNIFYNINAVNFEIISTNPTFIITNTSGDLSSCNSGNQTVNYSLSLDFINGFNESVSFGTSGEPLGSTVSFTPNTINSDGNVVMSISNLDGKAAQNYTINIQGNSTSVNQNIDVTLNLTASNLGTVTLISPVNNATEVPLTETFMWQEDTNASSYNVQVATDSAFSNIVSSGLVTTNSYDATNLTRQTLYYWRVKAINTCNEGPFSQVFSFTTENPSYCTSTYTDEANGSEHITNVTFNTINNNSVNDTVDGYEDFTSIETNVKRGDSHLISVTLDTAGFQDHCYVFIDWNQDFVFDKNTERYDLGNEFNDVATKSFNIAVPNDAIFGPTTMRVVIEYFDNSSPAGDGACDEDQVTEWGETEDYTVIVDNTASIEDIAFDGFNLYPNPTDGEFTLKLEVENTNKVVVQLYDLRGRLIDEKIYSNTTADFSEKIIFDKTSTGLYLLKVLSGKKQTTRKLIIK